MGKILDAVDTKALRFAIGFPVLLAAGFAVCAAPVSYTHLTLPTKA